MADQTTGGLQSILDPKNYPIYDRPESGTPTYEKAGEDILRALENRYSQPNWFKVAAGFLKPQLGGFAASLGSASEALAENIEQQRAMALPIAEVRAKLAQGQAIMAQNVPVADEIKLWHKEHPNEMPTPGLVAHWASKAPDLPAVKQLLTQQELAQKNQSLLATQQSTEMKLLAEQRANGDISAEQYKSALGALQNRLGGMASSPKGTTETAPQISAPAPAPVLAPALAPISTEIKEPVGKFDLRGPGRMESVKKAIENIADPIQKDLAMRAFNSQINPNNVKAEPKNTPVEPALTKKAAEPVFDTSKFEIKPSFHADQLNPRAVTEVEKANNARILAGAELLEGAKRKQFENLQIVNETVAFNTADEANKSVLRALDKYPQYAVETTNMLRRAGPLATAFAKGLGINLGPYGVHVRAEGLEPALDASLTPEKQAYRDRLLNDIAKSLYYDLKSRGIDPEKEGAEKFGQRMMQETHIGQGPAAIHRAIAQNDIRLQYSAELYTLLSNQYAKAIAAGSLTPLHDIQIQHPEIKVLNGLLKRRLEKAN